MDGLYILWALCSKALRVRTNGYMVRYWYCHGPYSSLSNELGFYKWAFTSQLHFTTSLMLAGKHRKHMVRST